jgi:hypothetical protein
VCPGWSIEGNPYNGGSLDLNALEDAEFCSDCMAERRNGLLKKPTFGCMYEYVYQIYSTVCQILASHSNWDVMHNVR